MCLTAGDTPLQRKKPRNPSLPHGVGLRTTVEPTGFPSFEKAPWDRQGAGVSCSGRMNLLLPGPFPPPDDIT